MKRGGVGRRLSPRGVQNSLQRGPLKARALGDVHPNVTAKLIHFSLSHFHLITATTCDDEKESGYQLPTTDASV